MPIDYDACERCNTRHCHRCGTDLTDRMGVMRWEPGLNPTRPRRIPGLWCVSCASELRAGDPDVGPACPEVYSVTIHGGRAGAYVATVAGRDGNLLPDGATATGPTIADALHELLTATWPADVVQWTLEREHELPAVCPHGRTAADRTVTPCTLELAGCVIP